MGPSDTRNSEREHTRRSLYTSLCTATQVMEEVANGLYTDYRQRRLTNRGRELSNPAVVRCLQFTRPSRHNATVVDMIRCWFREHEDVQVMLASILLVFGVWWLVRTVIGLLFNLICPLLIMTLAVVCVPQLRTPLLGQNYPALAKFLRGVLIKMADYI